MLSKTAWDGRLVVFLGQANQSLLEWGGECSTLPRFLKKRIFVTKMRPYIDFSGRNFTVTVKLQVEHLEVMCKLFTGTYDTVTLTEKGHLLSAMLMGIRRLKKHLDKAEREQQKTLLQKADFDAREIKGSLDSIIGKLEPYITKPNEDNEDFDIEDMLDIDNSEQLLSGDEGGGLFKQMRIYLLSNYYNIFSKIKDSTKRSDEILDSLIQIQTAIESDTNKRNEIWKLMNEYYQKTEWKDQESTLIFRIKQEKEDPDNKGLEPIQILDKVLKYLSTDHINEIYKLELKELNQTVLNCKQSPISVLMKHRDKLHEEDISNYFCFYFSHKFVSETQESIRLREAAHYDILFFTKAAQEYVETLIPVLKQYGGLNDKGHYGILKIVLQELGLADAEKANGIQMMDFVNEKLIDDETEKLPRQDSITLMTGKLNKQTFARLGAEGIGRTKFSDKEYLRVKDVYWRCFTILNYYRLVDSNEVRYDGYLALPHPFTKTYDPWENVKTDTKNRLTFLAFVLRGEGFQF